MSEPRVLLTTDQIDEWRAEKAELEAVISEKQKTLAAVTRKLEAAEVFLAPGLVHQIVKDTKVLAESRTEPKPAEPEPMTEASIRVIKELGGSATTGAVRAKLLKAGYDPKRLGNYFYTMMARHVERGRLIKRGKRYLLPEGDPLPKTQEAPSNTPHKDLLSASVETGLVIQ